ncbi:hypothetical protein BerOc1_02496 [Pseudodesulfovibrio hydrargyri]|uniref:Shedu protein SduA C-terminal domain-containing protein n=1 Tax=Pseudodesulfovibrio hydrargyri TaxID=2125990 RepID=A0A1J5N4L8_9BACT|nr:Shedu immune nuclease family protein [Pseudodesulfovibrio hydrargyri]OIQ50555.1 hypothetical protein BerOc1_02496 [Pseudodesulfovibrio hydrargyri]
MITIIKDRNRLLIKYESERHFSADWIDQNIQQYGAVNLKRVFTFTQHDGAPSDYTRIFILGRRRGEYFRINKDFLELKHDLLIAAEVKLTHKSFIAHRNISIFRKIDSLVNEQIVIGGSLEKAIPNEAFEDLLRSFPNTTELTHYAGARISRILGDYFETMTDAQLKLKKHLEHKHTSRLSPRVEFIKDYEAQKFVFIREELQLMLKSADSYKERDWQKKIVSFLLLIFPKYVAVLENLHIKDFYSNPSKTTDRYIDLTLVDANGTIDVIEIKQPFDDCLLSKRRYRDNYTPKMELGGSVMQVEKYLFHLNKWGREGERTIYEKRKDELPVDLKLQVTNPKAMVILGRDKNFDSDQRFDFEIIKRKYANIIDIMTYDDLLRRLDNIIEMIQR